MYSENESNTLCFGFNAQAHAPTICVTFISMSTGKQRGFRSDFRMTKRKRIMGHARSMMCQNAPTKSCQCRQPGCYTNQADTRRIFQFALHLSILAYFGQSSSQRGLYDNLLEKDDLHYLERDQSVQATREPDEGSPIIILLLMYDDGVRQKGFRRDFIMTKRSRITGHARSVMCQNAPTKSCQCKFKN